MSFYINDVTGKPRLEKILDKKEEHKLATIAYGILVAEVVALYIISFFI